MDKIPTPDFTNKVMRWVVLAFFGYAIIHSIHHGPKPDDKNLQAQAAQQTSEPKKEEDCSRHMPLLSIPLLPQITMAVHTQDVRKGTGSAAVCGQTADVKYEYIAHDGKILDKGEKKITIGDGKLLHGAEIGMIGMLPGGTRKIIMPPPFVYTGSPLTPIRQDIGNKPVTASITLHDLEPSLPSSAFPLRMMNMSMGSGGTVTCGDKVLADITVWKADGTEVFSTGKSPVSFIAGKSQVPYGIEQGAMGAMSGAERVIILPPSYNKPLISNPDTHGALPPLPENEILVARIEILHVGEFQTKETAASAEKKAPDAKKPGIKKSDTREPDTQEPDAKEQKD